MLEVSRIRIFLIFSTLWKRAKGEIFHFPIEWRGVFSVNSIFVVNWVWSHDWIDPQTGGKFIKELGRWVADEASEEARKKLDATLLNFRSGKLNCLVSTQVLEEGMDVKRCNLVVRFDKIQTLRSYVQVRFYLCSNSIITQMYLSGINLVQALVISVVSSTRTK